MIWAQFYRQKEPGVLIEMLGSDAVVYLDGRLSLERWTQTVLNAAYHRRAHRYTHFRIFSGNHLNARCISKTIPCVQVWAADAILGITS
jgi:hypothetical protein